MAAKQIAFDMEAREAIRRGVHQLARAVRVTLGPCGRNVVLEKSFGAPTVTKDGVTVAKEIELGEPYENMGAQMVKEVASKTSDTAGDGTTTATIYAEAIYDEGLKNLAAGADAMELKRGIDAAVDAVTAELESMSTPVKGAQQISQVGTCAANQDVEIGKHIAQAMERVGKDGVITPDSDPREGITGRPPTIDHRRGYRRRSTGHAGGQQAARDASSRSRKGARFRRPPQGHARRYEHPDRRAGDL